MISKNRDCVEKHSPCFLSRRLGKNESWDFHFDISYVTMYMPHNLTIPAIGKILANSVFSPLLIPIAGLRLCGNNGGTLLQCVPSLGRIFIYRRFFMKRIVGLFLFFFVLVAFSACGNTESHEGEAKSPSGSKLQKGKNYQDVIKEFSELGFTNIKTEKQEDLVFGWLTEDGEVEWVSIDGDKEYYPDRWYKNDVEVIVAYHTFPNTEANSDVETELPEEESRPGEVHAPSSDDGNQEKSQPEDDEILTVDNCEELREILENKNEMDEMYSEFSENYRGRTIRFDGNIAYIAKHSATNPITGKTKVYDTIFDLLIYVGDYDPNKASGPHFKFDGVSAYELPELSETNLNYTITAKVGEYDNDSGLWELSYDSMEIRE